MRRASCTVRRTTAGGIVFCWLNIILPIVFGTVFYLLFRPDTYISKFFYHILQVQPVTPIWMQKLPEGLRIAFCNFIPDILWAYALTFTITLLWNGALINSAVSFSICVFFEIMIEVCQKVGIIAGTFDWLDILFEICATVFAALIITIMKEKKE